MTVAVSKSRLTPDQFVALPDSRNYELIDGILVERKFMGAYASYIAGQIIYFLNAYAHRSGAGWVLDSETTYQSFKSRDTLRRADVSFVRMGRLHNERPPEGYVTIAPDLAVEVVSPSNSAYEVQEKVADYVDAGVGLIWIVYPNTRHVQVYEAGALVGELDETETITGGAVLAGFSCAVADFFKAPAPRPQS